MDKNVDRTLLGIRIGAGSLGELVQAAMRAVSERKEAFTFACANPHSLVVARSDPQFRAALAASSAVVADGVGVTVAAQLARVDVGPRITGTDFFFGTMRALNRRGGSVFFLGSSEAVLNRIVARTQQEYPNLRVTVLSPPYGEWDAATNNKLVEKIRVAQPDILWVGMTAPKQEKWVHANAAHLHVPVIGSIGAVFDFYAQTVERAPDILCRAGLEWLYRLLREPRRLWRRTLVSGPHFLWLVLHERVFVR